MQPYALTTKEYGKARKNYLASYAAAQARWAETARRKAAADAVEAAIAAARRAGTKLIPTLDMI